MTLSRDSVLAVQRHFIGALTVPPRTWLEQLPPSRLAFAGDGARAGGAFAVDFGIVESRDEQRRVLRVFHPANERVEVRIDAIPPWLSARWREEEGDIVHLDGDLVRATLELTARHDGDGEYGGAVRFAVHAQGRAWVEEVPARLVARSAHPAAVFDFNGSPSPRAFAFGTDDPPYRLSVANGSAKTVLVRFANLPEWLEFEADGQRRNGPLAGHFFERAAPFVVQFRPRFFGRHAGAMRLQTTDPRPGLSEIELPLTADVAAPHPWVRPAAAGSLRMHANERLTTGAQLENWGRSAARLAASEPSRGLEVVRLPAVPAASGGSPGTAVVPLRVIADQLPLGRHALSFRLRVEGGDPAVVDVPVNVEIVPARRRRATVRPELVGALVALVLLVLLFVLRGIL